MSNENLGKEIYNLAHELFPICRSITGNGVRKTLGIIQQYLPELTIHEVPSFTSCFDWTVPLEWNIEDAYIIDPEGNKIVDFKQNNLHIVSYSTPINTSITLEELQKHLYSLPEQPNAIPYITSYYNEYWGFCITHKQREQLKPGNYKVCIQSSLEEGHLTYGEWLLPGKTEKEVFLSTNICHPSLGNNELSGPTVSTFLARMLKELENRYFTYRLVFIPETIGSILYTSQHLEHLKKNVVAGFNISCVGDDRCYSYLPSRNGETLSDRVALHVLKYIDPNFIRYSYLDRGSDEKQYCSPGVDLPIASIMRSKYGCYPEYHTSLDNLDFITPSGLSGGYEAIRQCLVALEANQVFKVSVYCEPQLGKRGLYPSISDKSTTRKVAKMKNLICYCDGDHDLLSIAEKIQAPIWELLPIVEQLTKHGLLVPIEEKIE